MPHMAYWKHPALAAAGLIVAALLANGFMRYETIRSEAMFLYQRDRLTNDFRMCRYLRPSPNGLLTDEEVYSERLEGAVTCTRWGD